MQDRFRAARTRKRRRKLVIGLDGTDATASRPGGRRKGVHAGLILGGTDAKAQEKAYDRSGRQRRYS